MISNSQFFTNLITEFFKPSGPLSEKSQLTVEVNRPLLNSVISKGFNIDTTDFLEVELEGLEIKSGRNIFRQNCFEFNCFQEEGILTYVNNISDICLVSANRFLTKSQREKEGLSCYIDSNNSPTFFVRGTPDKENNVYVADIGVVNSTSGVFSIIDKNVPFFFNDKKNTLSALSIKKIPKGIKSACIKKVNKTSVKEIGIVYGELNNQFYFPHTQLKTNKKFTTKEQEINLENLAINLILLSSFEQFESKPNQIIYRNANFSSPEIKNTIKKSSETLINLILTENAPQKGSIPKHINSFSQSQQEYNSIADTEYINKVKLCFDKNCFDKGCFETIFNNSLLNRSIDNRSIAWTIQYLASYTVNYSEDITPAIQTLMQYLLNQKDKTTKLFYKGWDQKIEEDNCEELKSENGTNLIQEDNEEICKEDIVEQDTSIQYYANALIQNKEIITSTNVAIFMALLKTFEVTQNFNYIIEADTLYSSITKYLINNEGLYKHSLLTTESSLESVTYNFLLSLILESYSSINLIIDFLKIRLTTLPPQNNEDVFVRTSVVLVGSQEVELPPANILDSDSDFNLFTPTTFDTIQNIEDIFKYNYLLSSSFLHLNTKLHINFINEIEEKLNIIKLKVEESRENSALIFSIASLINNNSFINNEAIKFNSLFEFNNYQFQKALSLNALLINTPKDYGWFAINKVNKMSTLGNIYSALAQSLAKNITEYESIKRNISINNMYGITLNKKAKEYNLIRFAKESDVSFRQRIKNEIYTRGVNKVSIENRTDLFNSPASVKNNYTAVLAIEDNSNNTYTDAWGLGYLQGSSIFNTNISTLNFNQPVEQDVYEEVYKFKPIGTKLHIRENLTFIINKSKTLITIKDLTPSCPHLKLEESNNYLSESNNLICLED